MRWLFLVCNGGITKRKWQAQGLKLSAYARESENSYGCLIKKIIIFSEWWNSIIKSQIQNWIVWIAELQCKWKLQTCHISYVKVRDLIGKKWDLEIWNKDILGGPRKSWKSWTLPKCSWTFLASRMNPSFQVWDGLSLAWKRCFISPVVLWGATPSTPLSIASRVTTDPIRYRSTHGNLTCEEKVCTSRDYHPKPVEYGICVGINSKCTRPRGIQYNMKLGWIYWCGCIYPRFWT